MTPLVLFVLYLTALYIPSTVPSVHVDECSCASEYSIHIQVYWWWHHYSMISIVPHHWRLSITITQVADIPHITPWEGKLTNFLHTTNPNTNICPILVCITTAFSIQFIWAYKMFSHTCNFKSVTTEGCDNSIYRWMYPEP
jgi:hypothetical protein